ncbi:hypothetical protein R0J90_19030, partial [Micrococcus sp. SIMBA_144]
ITPVFAEERANESSLQSDITLVENTEEEITVQTNAEKENAVVSATLDKESNTFTINSTEENELGQMIEKSYNVIVNTATDEEFIA